MKKKNAQIVINYVKRQKRMNIELGLKMGTQLMNLTNDNIKGESFKSFLIYFINGDFILTLALYKL